MVTPAAHVIFTQKSARKGLKMFEEKAADAIIEEFKQIHDREVFVLDIKRCVLRL